MKYFFNLIKDWFVFLLHPRDVFPKLSLNNKVKSYIFYCIFFILTSVSLSYASEYLFFKLWIWHIIPYPIMIKYEGYPLFFYAVILGPIHEELVSRLSLRFKPIFLAISITFELFYIITALILKVLPFYNFWYTIGNLTIILVITILLYFFIKIFKNQLERLWAKHLRMIFYLFAIYFGYMHLGNYYTYHYSIILLSPIFIFPYIFVGLNLGFIRLKYGIVFCILLHAFNNLIPQIIRLF